MKMTTMPTMTTTMTGAIYATEAKADRFRDDDDHDIHDDDDDVNDDDDHGSPSSRSGSETTRCPTTGPGGSGPPS